jgi:ribosomal subunit interface protein
VGSKTRSAEREPSSDRRRSDTEVELTFTGRGLAVTDELRDTATHKLARLGRIEPRTTRIELEFISEDYPRPDGTKRVEAALQVPRKTFRAHAEAQDVPTALDRVADRLERQLRDHHGKRRSRLFRRFRRKNPLESASQGPGPADTTEE